MIRPLKIMVRKNQVSLEELNIFPRLRLPRKSGSRRKNMLIMVIAGSKVEIKG